MTFLRKAVASDAIDIALLHANSWRENYRGIYSAHFLKHEVLENRIAFWQHRFLSSDLNQRIFVVTVKAKIVGFACILLAHDAVYGALLDNLHVSKDYQGHGVGKMLIEACRKASKNIYLWVYDSNHRARRVYEHLGATFLESEILPLEDGTTAKACRYIWRQKP